MTTITLSDSAHISATAPTYNDIQSIVVADFEMVDKQVFGSLNSKVQLVMSVSQHVINAVANRMRPLWIVLLCSMYASG